MKLERCRLADNAYLYSDNHLDAWKEPETEFYDSRWVLPLAWFFFFRAEDVHLIHVHYNLETFEARYGDDSPGQWREVRLRAEKDAALELFQLRKPLLMSIVGDRIGAEAVEGFFSTVSGRPGRHLFMNPDEVLGGINGSFDGDEGHAKRIAHILVVLGEGAISAEVAVELTKSYVKEFSADPDRFEGQILGYTYTWRGPGWVGGREPTK